MSAVPPPGSATPLPAWSPPDHHASLTTDQRALLDDFCNDYGEENRNLLGAFLVASDWDEDLASEGFEGMQKTHAEVAPKSLDYASLLGLVGKNATTGRPLPCVVALEDGHGGVARTKRGMPILAMLDHMEGKEEDWIAQIHFAVERVRLYSGSKEFPSVAFVLDSVDATQQPDASMNNLKFLRYISSFPGNYVCYMCGAASGPASAALMRPFVEMIGASRIRVCTRYEQLVEDVDAAHRLPQWCNDASSVGTFDLDLDKHREWLRAQVPLASDA